jgi:phosphinothricin acetyltransferase
MDRRRCEIQEPGLPYLVAESDGIIAGYAYAGRYRTRPAYRFTLEDSVYVHPDFISRGYGQLLLGRLIDSCIAKGSRQMIAVIGDSSNVASIRLHAKFAFREIGVLEGVGRKFGRWIDTVIMQRALYSDKGVQQIREIVAHNGETNATLQTVADVICQSGRYRWVGLYKVDHNAGEVRNLVFSGIGAPAHPVFSVQDGITGIAIREKRTVNIGDVNANPLYLTAFGTTRSEIIVPIYAATSGGPVGTIDVESEDLQAFSEEDEVFLEDCAQAISPLWNHA